MEKSSRMVTRVLSNVDYNHVHRKVKLDLFDIADNGNIVWPDMLVHDRVMILSYEDRGGSIMWMDTIGKYDPEANKMNPLWTKEEFLEFKRRIRISGFKPSQ